MDNDLLVDISTIKPDKVYTLWRFFDAQNALLYVSQKPNPAILMKHEWWKNIDHIHLKHFTSLDALADEKAIAIYNEDPKWNTIGKRTEID